MAARIQIAGSTALVTGGGSGIGRATALALARRGADVVVVDIDEAAAKATADTIAEQGRSAAAHACDVADRAALVELRDQLARDGVGGVDVLVNNAGVGLSARFLDADPEDWDWIRSVNLDGVIHGCQVFVPGMLDRGRGHVVNVSSGLGYVPSAMTAAYSTTKAGVLMFSRSVRPDWGLSGVGVSVICPGVIDTAIIQATRFAGAVDTERARAMAVRGFSQGHAPDLVARAIVGAIERNRAVVPVGLESHVGWYLSRVLPVAVVDVLARPLPAGAGRLLRDRH